MKENRRRCLKCGASPSENPSIILHRFPKPGRTNSLRCELWAKYCFPLEQWHSKDFQAKLYSQHRMLCTKHFNKTYFVDPLGSKMVKYAVPDEEIEQVHTDEVPDVPEPSQEIEIATTSQDIEPVAGPSYTQPLMENINILNIDQSIGQHQMLQQGSKMSISNETIVKKCKKHMRKIYQLQHKIKKLNNKSFINEIADSDSVSSILKENISPTAALFLQGELRNYKKASRARRWDTDSKIVALRLYKRSPTCYKLLRRMLCLPAPSTLKNLLSKFKMGVGINSQIFRVLKKASQNVLKQSDKEFVLIWDEMSLKKNLHYNSKEDMVEGFQDHAGQGRSPAIAAYALVFMVVGLRKAVKQPVAFYFSAGCVTADRLGVLIKEVLHHCFDAGLKIAATVCDLDGVNKRSLCNLGATLDQPYIQIKNHEVVTLFDTPHLLKCFRNLFLKYNIEYPVCSLMKNGSGIGVAKWSHVKEFYEVDNNNPQFVFAPSLKDDHLNPNSKQKMKVSLAAQVLSHSVAAGMYARISKGELSTAAVATADMIAKIDKLFDSVNSCTPDLRRGKPLATNIKKNSKH